MYPKKSMTQARAANIPRPAAAAPRGRRIQVRRSGVHGKGVFALAPIPKGEVIIEYKREIPSGSLLVVRTTLRRLGNKSVEFLHELCNVEIDALHSTCEQVTPGRELQYSSTGCHRSGSVVLLSITTTSKFG